MLINKREDKEMFGEVCDVKHIQTYTKDEFIAKFSELTDYGYINVWKCQEGIILRQKYRPQDIVILYCKCPIKTSWCNPQYLIKPNKQLNMDTVITRIEEEAKAQGYHTARVSNNFINIW